MSEEKPRNTGPSAALAHEQGNQQDHAIDDGGHVYVDAQGNSRSAVSRWASEIAALNRHIKHESEQLAGYKYHNGQRAHENEQLDAQIRSIRTHALQIKEEITTVEQDLEATRVHAPDEGAMSERDLIHEFHKVTKSVDAFVQELSGWFHRYIDKGISESRSRKISESFQGEVGRKDADMFLALAILVDMPLRPVVEALFHYYVCSSLMANIFEPFLPGKSNEETAHLHELIVLVQGGEPQDSSGRWRALTYKTALEPRDVAWCTDPAAMFLQRISHILAIVADIDMNERAVSEVLRRITELFNMAACFKDMAMTKCTEVDFRVFLPFGNNDITTLNMQESAASQKDSKNVVLGTGLGLEIFHDAERGSGRVRETYCPVPSSVIGDKSRLFARPSRSLLSSLFSSAQT